VADTVASLADAAIGINDSEAATSKTALRQSTTMLLDHFDRTPRDCEQELLEEAVTSDPPHNSSVRESGGVESRHLIDRLLAASAAQTQDATSSAGIVVNNQLAHNLKILPDLEPNSVTPWVRSIEAAAAANQQFNLLAYLSDPVKQLLGAVLQRDQVFRNRFINVSGDAGGFLGAATYWSTAPALDIVGALGRLFPSNARGGSNFQTPLEAVKGVTFTLDPAQTKHAYTFAVGITDNLKRMGFDLKSLKPAEEFAVVKYLIAKVPNIQGPHPECALVMREMITSGSHLKVVDKPASMTCPPVTLEGFLENLFIAQDAICAYASMATKLGFRLTSKEGKSSQPGNVWSEQNSTGKNTGKKRNLSDSGEPSGSAIDQKRKRPGEEPNLCHGCGRKHPGECRLSKHPNFNKNSQVPWAKSANGLKFLQLDSSIITLPTRKRLSDDRSSIIDYDPKKVCDLAYLLFHDPTNDCVVMGSISEIPGLNFRVLLDSGAQYDYVSREFADRVMSNSDFSICPCTNRLVCGIANNCINSNECAKMSCLLSHNNKNINLDISTRVLVGIQYDLIIGLNTIRRYKLTQVFRTLFNNNNDNLKFKIHEKYLRTLQNDGLMVIMDDIDETTTADEIIQALTQRSLRGATEYDNIHNIVEKSDLLDMEEDDDYVDEYLETEDAALEQMTMSGSDITLNTDTHISLVKLAGSPQLQHRIQNEILSKYGDCLSTTLKSTPAKIKEFSLEIKDEQAKRAWDAATNKRAPRAQSSVKQKAIEEFIEAALRTGMIEATPTATSWSQILLTKKPNGKWRFCLDYRALNELTKSMGWPIPNIHQMLRRIGDKRPKIFGVLDLTMGYHQSGTSEQSRDLTAFRTARGVYRWNRLPMGLKGAPSHFQHQMQTEVLKDLMYNICEIYLDDIIIYAETEEEFIERLDIVFNRLKEYNITVNPEKVKLGMSEIEYLGHIINSEGLSFSQKKRDEVFNFKKPETQKQMRSFLGLTGQFRDHVRYYDRFARPLQETYHNYKPYNKINWTTHLEECFVGLQAVIHACPQLYFIDETAPIILETDASQYGIGAYLYQIIDGIKQPIAFMSKTLTKAELKWSTIEKEAYAIFVAFRKFEHLLRDVHFTLRTDHRNLTFLNVEAREKVKRWKLAIQHYDFSIEHIKGSDNIVADGFSRFCQFPENSETEKIMMLQILDDIDRNFLGDEEYSELLSIKEINSTAFDTISKYHNALVGHFGVDRTYQRMQNDPKLAEWPNMKDDVKAFVQQCALCQKLSAIKQDVKTRPFTLACYSPMSRIAIDTLGPLPETEKGYKYVIVIIDAFSRFVKLYPCQDVTALSAMQAILEWIGIFGCPEELVSDNGTQFSNELIDNLLELMNTRDLKIHAYSKEENALVERANKEVLRHLRAICYNKKMKTIWYNALPLVQRIINAQVHKSIGVSPSHIIFGNAINLDRGFLEAKDNISTNNKNYSEHLINLLDAQEYIIKLAQQQQRETDEFHIKQRAPDNVTSFPINSFVLVNYENEMHKPPSKLHTYRRGPLQVMKIDGNVYTLKNLVTNKLEDFHVKLLKPFVFNKDLIDPSEVAMHDEDYHIITEICNHKFTGSRTKRSNLKFLIRWDNEIKPTWYKWSQSLAVNEEIHKYLKKNKLKRFIPPRYTWPKDHPNYNDD
jgi:hypothetical protein